MDSLFQIPVVVQVNLAPAQKSPGPPALGVPPVSEAQRSLLREA